MYHGNQPCIITNANGNTMMMTAYLPTSHPHNCSSAMNYQDQAVVQALHIRNKSHHHHIKK